MGFLDWGVGQALGKVPFVGWAYSVTSLIKSVVDDYTKKQLDEVRDQEGCPHIKDCASYGICGQQINAMTAAKDGKTAWEAPNLLWVYHDQVDYKPIHARLVYQQDGNGNWTSHRGGRITGVACRRCLGARSKR